jgi:hypothetical protein
LDIGTFKQSVVVSEAIPVAVNVMVPVGGSLPWGTTMLPVNVTASPRTDAPEGDPVREEAWVGFGPKTPSPFAPHETLEAMRPSASTSPVPIKVTPARGAMTKPLRAVIGPLPTRLIAVAFGAKRATP